MAITDVASALAQYNANLNWNTSQAAAQLALEAIRYLIVNQPQSYSTGVGQSITKNLSQLENEKQSLEKLLGVGPRAFGRCRRVGVDYDAYGIAGIG